MAWILLHTERLQMRIALITRLLLPALLLTAMSGCNPREASESAVDFRLERLDGRRFYLNRHADKIVCLVFWQVNCAPCKEELSALSSLSKTLSRDRVLIVGVCVDPEDEVKVKSIVDAFSLDFPILLDVGAEVAGRYGVDRYPVTLIIRDARDIILRRVGYDQAIHKQIENVLHAAAE